MPPENQNSVQEQTKQPIVITKHRKVFISGILILWFGNFIAFGETATGFETGGPDWQGAYFGFVPFAFVGFLLMAKGSGIWFSNQDRLEKIGLTIAGIFALFNMSLLAFIASFFFVFPFLSIFYIVLIAKTRKW